MSFKHIIKPFLAAALASALTLVSCTKEDNPDEAVGYLACPLLDVDLTVDNLPDTKSVTLPDVPDPSGLVFSIKQGENVVKTVEGTWGDPLVLPVGEYTIEASSGYKDSFGSPYFFGSTTAEVQPLSMVTPSLEVSLANSLVYITLSSDLKKHFTYSSSKLNEYSAQLDEWIYVPSGSAMTLCLYGSSSAGVAKTLEFSLGTPAPKNAYHVICNLNTEGFPSITLPEQQGGAWASRLFIDPATVSGSISDSNKATMYYEVSSSETDWSGAIRSTQVEGEYHVVNGLTNGTQYYVRARIGNIISNVVGPITFAESLPDNPVALSHTYDSSSKILGKSMLTGSQAELNLSFPPIVKEFADKGLLTINSTLFKGEEKMRTSTDYGGVMAVVTNSTTSSPWTYLPHGDDYKLEVSYKLKNEANPAVFYKNNLSINEPDYAVGLGSSYSSYDKYAGTNGIIKNIDEANNSCNAETIYNVGALWSISPSLINNANYSVALKLYNGSTELKSVTPTDASYFYGNITGLTTWQDYTLKASMVFDGMPSEATKTHKITGLPYSYDFYANQNIPANWTSSNIKWNNTGLTKKLIICDNGSNGYLISPKFNFTGAANYTVEAQYYSTISGDDILMFVGATSTRAPADKYDSHAVPDNMKTDEDHKPYYGSLNISASTPYVSIYHNQFNNTKWFFGEAIDYLCIYEFYLKYK